MMIMKRLLFLVSVCSLCMVGNSQNYQPEKHAVVKSDRGDGRLLSTYAIVHEMLKDTHPQYAYRSGMSAQEFTQWQDGVRAAMVEIMKFPEIKGQPSPVCVKTEKKEGYILEKWEFYPFPKSVSTFLVLKPEHLKGAVPGVLCIPGSGRTKEGLAGEPGICDKLTEDYNNPKVSMALNMVKEGYVAVAVDNAAAGEASDLCVYSDIRILETTTSVEKARKIVIRQQPDLLFLDVEMPKMSGLDLWQNIRADVHADMRVVFYTAYDKYVLEALRASAFDYLLKPYLPEELDAVIERFRCVFYRSRVNMEQSMRRLLADDCKFAIQTVTGLLFLKRSDVLLFRFSDVSRCWQLYLSDRTDYKLRMSVSARDLMNMSVSFVQISQNCIVNLDYLCSIENKTLECHLYPPFDDIELIASRRYFGKVKEWLEIL